MLLIVKIYYEINNIKVYHSNNLTGKVNNSLHNFIDIIWKHE